MEAARDALLFGWCSKITFIVLDPSSGLQTPVPCPGSDGSIYYGPSKSCGPPDPVVGRGHVSLLTILDVWHPKAIWGIGCLLIYNPGRMILYRERRCSRAGSATPSNARRPRSKAPSAAGEKDAKLVQKLGQLQPVAAVFLPKSMGQLASFRPT
jgi:hypothetical protein